MASREQWSKKVRFTFAMAAVMLQAPGHQSRRCPQELWITGHREGRTAAGQGTPPSCLLGKQRQEPGEGKVHMRSARGQQPPRSGQRYEHGNARSKVLELSEETYQQLHLAQHQQRPLENMRK